MKKPLIFFVIGVIILIIAAIMREKYCKENPHSCKKSIQNDIGDPKEGIDW